MSRILIVGGGIHGTHIAARLVGEGDLRPEDLTLVDPSASLLDRWKHCVDRTGMQHLRSPAVHHIGLHPFELLRYDRDRPAAERSGARPFIGKYKQPSVDLFNAHADHVVGRFGLGERHHQGRAIAARLTCRSVELELEDGEVLAGDTLVLAMGATAHPYWPAWASALEARGGPVAHLFSPDGLAVLDEPPAAPAVGSDVAVVGAGISGVQAALRLAEHGQQVQLIAGHPLRVHSFDSDPGWLGPKHMRAFLAEPDRDRRRARIRSARHPGSVPARLNRALRRAVETGAVKWTQGPVTSASSVRGGVRLVTPSGAVDAQQVILATGFRSARPGGGFVDALVESAELPCAGCGYPLVDRHLRWHPRVLVTGPLAELELGPSARNIAGARQAATRMLGALPR